jgi:2-methylcitrate dehydratase PrpD
MPGGADGAAPGMPAGVETAGITAAIAQLVCGFDGARLDTEALIRAKHGMLDALGVALAGVNEPVSKIMLDYAAELPAGAGATIWGSARRIALTEAALVNGTLAHALDYDDMNRSMLGHPSSVLTAALLPLAETLHLPGRKVVEAYIVGLEAMARIGRIFGLKAYDYSWHPTAVLGVLGATAGACYLLRLDTAQTINALGIAASEASGIKKNFGAMMKSVHAGSAARKGIWAAQFARRGLAADAAVLEGKFGFLDMFNGTPDAREAPDAAARPLDIIAAGLVFKQYPCCGGLHSLLDVMLDLRTDKGLTAADVVDIECRVHPQKVAYLDRPQPADSLSAKFSIQYCVAVALLRGKVGLADFTAAAIIEPAARALMKKIRIDGRENFAGFECEIVVRKTDGGEITGRTLEARGSPGNPLSEAELLRKFTDCAETILTPAQSAEAGAALLALDRETDLDRIVALLCPC